MFESALSLSDYVGVDPKAIPLCLIRPKRHPNLYKTNIGVFMVMEEYFLKIFLILHGIPESYLFPVKIEGEGKFKGVRVYTTV